jgi:hypothetical protein
MQVRSDSITPEIVRKAWKSTGLYPFNPDVFTEADYAPSRITSTQFYLPSTFPIIPQSIPTRQSSPFEVEVVQSASNLPCNMVADSHIGAIEDSNIPISRSLSDVENLPDIALGPQELEFIPRCVDKRINLASQLEIVQANLEYCYKLYQEEFDH